MSSQGTLELDPSRTMHEELAARGWLYLRDMGSSYAELDAWSKVAPYHWAAVRLSDGLIARAPTGTLLLAQIEALTEAAKQGTKRPAWVPAGLGYDVDKKVATWPAPVPVRVLPAPTLMTAAEVCACDGHIPSVRHAGTCGSCHQPFLSAPKGGANG
jgi:hypothetical protein